MSTRCLTLCCQHVHNSRDAANLDTVTSPGGVPTAAASAPPGGTYHEMQRVCSYCETDLATGEVVTRPYTCAVSHGICHECLATEMAALDLLDQEDGR